MSVERTWGTVGVSQEDSEITEIGLYLEEINKFPRLERREEIDLGGKIKAGRKARARLSRGDLTAEERVELSHQVSSGEEAKEKLIISNLRLVVWKAKKHQGRGVRQTLPILDLCCLADSRKNNSGH